MQVWKMVKKIMDAVQAEMDAVACFQIDDGLYEQLTVNTYLKCLLNYQLLQLKIWVKLRKNIVYQRLERKNKAT